MTTTFPSTDTQLLDCIARGDERAVVTLVYYTALPKVSDFSKGLTN